MAVSDTRYNVDLERYISRATRNPPSHFDWQTWRKVGPPGQYQAPPGVVSSFRGVTSGAGRPNYGPTASHYNEFDGRVGGMVADALQQGIGGLNNMVGRRSRNAGGGGGGTTGGGGGGTTGSGRSQNLSVTAPASSRSMRRGGRGNTTFDQTMQNLGITMTQGNDVYGNVYGNVGGPNVGSGNYNMPYYGGGGGGTFPPGAFPPPGGGAPPPPPPPGGGNFPPPTAGGGAPRQPRTRAPRTAPTGTQPAGGTMPPPAGPALAPQTGWQYPNANQPVRTQVTGTPALPMGQQPAALQTSGATAPAAIGGPALSSRRQAAYESMMGAGRTQAEYDMGFRGLGFQGPMLSEVGTGPQPAAPAMLQPVQGPTNPATTKRQQKPLLNKVPLITGADRGPRLRNLIPPYAPGQAMPGVTMVKTKSGGVGRKQYGPAYEPQGS